MEEESREGMLEYQEDQKGLHRANLWRERLEHKILRRGPKNLSNNINFSHRINYYNTVDIINKIPITIHYCTITGKMHIFTITCQLGCGNRARYCIRLGFGASDNSPGLRSHMLALLHIHTASQSRLNVNNIVQKFTVTRCLL